MIACIAIIGKANNPLYVRGFDPKTEVLKFHYILHAALDIVDEKVLQTKKPGPGIAPPELYLGLLYPTEDFRVYGYLTNSKAKLMVIVDDREPRDLDARAFLKRMHALFADVVSNPFYNPDERIQSSSFDAQVVNVVRAFSAGPAGAGAAMTSSGLSGAGFGSGLTISSTTPRTGL